jgi:hypothetical protein
MAVHVFVCGYPLYECFFHLGFTPASDLGFGGQFIVDADVPVTPLVPQSKIW